MQRALGTVDVFTERDKSTLGFVMGDPIFVPSDATGDDLVRARQLVEDALDETTEKAYALADADPARATPPKPCGSR